MSERPGRRASQPQKESKEQPQQGEGARPKPARGAHQMKSLQSLEQLRERVSAATEELKRLRQENTALAARIAELETRPAVDAEGAFVSFDEDPDVLRQKVASFIEAIDQYLGQERAE